MVPPTGGLLVLTNGHFGERIAAIAEVHRLRTTIWNQGWGCAFDLPQIEQVLIEQPFITHVAVVHHETSTGQLNDVRRIGELVAAAGRSLIVDAVSSLGGEDLNVARDHIDWCVTSSNKCLEAPPGLAFVIGRKTCFRDLADVPPRSFYLSLYNHYEAQMRRGVPLFTPALHLMAATLCALELLLAEGPLQRRDRYRRLAAVLRDGLEGLGLPLYLPDLSTRSSTSTNVALPPDLTFEQLQDHLRAAGVRRLWLQRRAVELLPCRQHGAAQAHGRRAVPVVHGRSLQARGLSPHPAGPEPHADSARETRDDGGRRSAAARG